MIEIRELVWDEHNVPHIWERHHLTPEQVEEACHANYEHVLVEETYGHRLRILAPRPNGKLLVVILAPKGKAATTLSQQNHPSARSFGGMQSGKQVNSHE
jgi:hypothetical protein